METIEQNSRRTFSSLTLSDETKIDIKSKVSELLKNNIIWKPLKIREWLFKINLNWTNYYVCYVDRKYNFSHSYENESKMLMDAWSIIDKNESAWVIFVTKENEDAYILQTVHYDSLIDHIYFDWNNQDQDLIFSMINWNI